MPWIADVEGSRAGWFVVLHNVDRGDVRCRVVPDVRENVKKFTGGGVQADDIFDAYAVCCTARRLFTGHATRIPEPPPRDARGLRMEVWR